jgi:hypothetical protein
MRDLHNNLKAVRSVDPIVATADTNGDGVDLQFYEGALVLYHFGITGDTLSASVKVACELEESVDNSVWTAVAAADVLGTLQTVDDAAEDDEIYQVGYIGSKRYIRPVFNFTGTHTNGIEIAASVVKGFPIHAPAA